MRKFVVTSLLILCFSCCPTVSFAQNTFNYGIKPADESFNSTVRYEDENGSLLNVTTYDFVPVLDKSVVVPVGQKVSAFGIDLCKMSSGGYDLTGAILETLCANNASYSLTVASGKEDLTTDSFNGRVLITGIPEGEISAYIKNKENVDLSCRTYLMGIASDTTPEEGFNINLNCYNKVISLGHRLKYGIYGLALAISSMLLAF